MNKVLLVGRVGKTPETTVFEGGKKVTKFSLATTDFKETNWHNIVIWGEYGETMAKYITTGSQLGVEGRVQYNAYEKEGAKTVYTTIVSDKVELMGKKTDSESESSEEQPTKPEPKSSKPAQAQKVVIPQADPSDDLPF